MTTSSTSWIYLAGPLFTQAEITFNQSLADRFWAAGYSVYLPQQECSGITDPIELFESRLDSLYQPNPEKYIYNT